MSAKPVETAMIAILRLFKALPISPSRKMGKSSTTTGKHLFKTTVEKGFLFSPEVIFEYGEKQCFDLIPIIDKELGLSADKMNSSFHKSWKKVATASMEQLVVEQIFHYITTYGFERMGCYDKNTVYIPTEDLEIPKIDVDKIPLIVIKGYTKEELKEKFFDIVGSGIALKEDTKNDIVTVAKYVGIEEEDLANIRNKEVKICLYDYLDMIPKEPIEFLRFVIYKATGRTLLIKDNATIMEIKNHKSNFDVYPLFKEYQDMYGLSKLAEIFLRFKVLFLAFRENETYPQYKKMNPIINKIRKLAVTNHKPMKEDFLNSVTSMISQGKLINKEQLLVEMGKVNIFRKIRLAYALNFRAKACESIMYRIRNGKSYAKEFQFNRRKKAQDILNVVRESIVNDISDSVKGKKIYIPDYIHYALPATEKQFTDNIPAGSYISVDKDMVIGVHWENLEEEKKAKKKTDIYNYDDAWRNDGNRVDKFIIS